METDWVKRMQRNLDSETPRLKPKTKLKLMAIAMEIQTAIQRVIQRPMETHFARQMEKLKEIETDFPMGLPNGKETDLGMQTVILMQIYSRKKKCWLKQTVILTD